MKVKDCSKLADEAMRSFSGLLYVCIVFALQTSSLEKFRKLLLKLSFMYDILSLEIDTLLSKKYYVRFTIL